MLRKFFGGLMIFTAFGLTACDDPLGPLTEFDPVATEEAVGEMVESLAVSDDALVSLQLATQTLGDVGFSAALLPDPSSPSRLLPRLDAIAGTGGPALQTTPLFPQNYLGKTFVYDAESDRYVIDETLAGAPANGVRFIYYAINPATDLPVEPLTALGHLDITDESGAQGVQVGFLVVDESSGSARTLLDYFISVSYSLGAGAVTVQLDADGFLSDGTETLDFELGYAVAVTEDLEQLEVEIAHHLSMPSQDISLDFVATGVAAAGQEDQAVLTGTMTAHQGANATVLDFAIEGEAIDGVVDHNGETVVLISGTNIEPIFTDAEGEALTEEEIAALAGVWDAIEILQTFADAVLNPFSEI